MTVQMHLEDMGREALFYHKLHIFIPTSDESGSSYAELKKETLRKVICSNLLLYSLIHSTNIYPALTV